MFGALLSSILPATSKVILRQCSTKGFVFVSVAQALFVIDNRDRSFAGLYYLLKASFTLSLAGIFLTLWGSS